MCFAKSKFPWVSCILYRCKRCCTSSSITARDDDLICISFCNTGSNSANSGSRNKFNSYNCIRIYLFHIKYKLSQILYRIDIMMRRRRYKSNSWNRKSQCCYKRRYFMTWQLSTLSWFCTLSYFYLYLFSTSKILRCHTKSSRCYLFYL